MVDIALSVRVDRTDLGLSNLDLNDHTNYFIAGSGFLGGSVAWNRNQVASPFIDGSVTVNRNRQMVTENLTVECLGSDYPDLMTQLGNVIDAMSQDNFVLQIAFALSVLEYQCEAADYTVAYSTDRWAAHQVQVIFQIPRQPVPVTGRF